MEQGHGDLGLGLSEVAERSGVEWSEGGHVVELEVETCSRPVLYANLLTAHLPLVVLSEHTMNMQMESDALETVRPATVDWSYFDAKAKVQPKRRAPKTSQSETKPQG